MRAQWRVADTDVTTRQALATATGLSPLLCQVLINRGITDAAAAGAFLTPSLHDLHDPYGLHGMKQAVQRLVAAIRQGECIAIYGDYDVDGVTATALLVTFFMSWVSGCRITFQSAPAKGMVSMLILCDNSPVRGYAC